MAGDDAVAWNELLRHAEVAAAVRDQLVDFLERAGIEEELDSLARGQFAGVMLALLPLRAAAQLRAALEIGEHVLRIHPTLSPPAPSPNL